jgi:uncharacterized protein YjbI with pentapeptide repeats
LTTLLKETCAADLAADEIKPEEIAVGFDKDGRARCVPLFRRMGSAGSQFKLLGSCGIVGSVPKNGSAGISPRLSDRVELDEGRSAASCSFNTDPPSDLDGERDKPADLILASGTTIIGNRFTNLSGVFLPSSVVLSGDLDFADLRGLHARIMGPVLRGATLRGAVIKGGCANDLSLADLTGADIECHNLATSFEDAILVAATLRLSGSFPPSLNFNHTDMRRVKFSPTTSPRLTDATFVGANLSRATFGPVSCERVTRAFGCDFTGANLSGADLSRLRAFGQGPAFGFERAIWSNTTCPDGSNSDTDDGDGFTCLSNLL